MTAIPCLFLILSSAALSAQDSNPLLTHWNSPQLPTPAVRDQPQAKIEVVLLRDASQVQFPESTRVADGAKGADGSLVFMMNNGKTSQTLKFNLIPREGEPTKEGAFRIYLGCGYPEYEFVRGSEAEKELLSLLKRSRDAIVGGEEPSSSSEGLSALNALLEYFPDDQSNKKKQRKPDMATPGKPSD